MRFAQCAAGAVSQKEVIMKKLFSTSRIALALALVLALSLFTACGGEKEDQDASTPVSSTSEIGEFVKGTTTDDTYKSEYFNLQFELPSGYMFIASDLIDQILASTDVDTSELEDALSAISYEMMAISSAGTSTIVVMTQEVDAMVDLDGQSVTQIMRDEFTKLEGQGYTVGELETTMIGGAEYESLTLAMELEGMSISQGYYFRMHGTRYICIITVCVGDGSGELISNFTALK